MKLGCNSFSFHKMFYREEITQLGWMELSAKSLRVDGLELIFDQFPRTDNEYLDLVVRRAQELGLELYCVSPGNDFGALSAHERDADIANLKMWIDRAQRMRIPMVRVYAGSPKADKEKQWPEMIRCMKDVARYAEHKGRLLVLENSSRASFAGSGDEVLRIIREVGSPALAPLLDTGNFFDGIASIEKVAPSAKMVHAKFWHPMPDGSDAEIDYPRIIPILRRAGFDGYLSIEHEAEDEFQNVPRCARYLRSLL